MHSVSARLLGILLLVMSIAGPIAGPELLGQSAPAVAALAQDASPASEAITPEHADLDTAITADSPTDPLTDTPTAIGVAPAETAPDLPLQTISAVIDDPTTCVAGRSWWFSISNAVAQEKNPAEITVTFVGHVGIAVPFDSPGSGAGFEAIYILSGNLDATLESATAQVDSTLQYTFVLVKGPHCPGIPDDLASLTPTSTPTNTATATATPTITPTITQTPRPTRQITAQLDDPEQCGDRVFAWEFSISNPVGFDMNPGTVYASFVGANNITVYASSHQQQDANGYTNFYFLATHTGDTLVSAMAYVDAAVDHTFKLLQGPKCSVRTPTPTNTPTITPTSTLTSTPTFTPTVLPGMHYVFATLDDARPCQISTARWRFAIVTQLSERANPTSIDVTFADGTFVIVPRSETVRDEIHALISYYDWNQNLGGAVISAKAMVSTEGIHLFVLAEGPNCFGSPTPTVTSTPDQTCNTPQGEFTRICAVIDLKSCRQSSIWTFALAPQFIEPVFPKTITVNYVDGSSRTVEGFGAYRNGQDIWQDYTDYGGPGAQPGAAWAAVPSLENQLWGYIFRLKAGPGCHGVGGVDPSIFTATPTEIRGSSGPTSNPALSRTPYPTEPSHTPTPPIGVLPATGAGDSNSSPGIKTLLTLVAILGLGLAIRHRNARGATLR